MERKTTFGNLLQLRMQIKSIILDDGVGGLRGDAALVVGVPAHLDVAVDTPAGAPGVLDEPVVAAALGAIADDQHSVVQTSAGAAGLVVHTARVQLERGVRGVDGRGHGADVGDGVLQSALAAVGDVDVAGEGGHVVSIGLAEVVTGGVGVGGFRLDAIVVPDVTEDIAKTCHDLIQARRFQAVYSKHPRFGYYGSTSGAVWQM